MPVFDPYHRWLGISPKDQPPTHYRLLGIDLFEADPDAIDNAADRQMAHLRSVQTGRNSALAQALLNEISAARVCLLDPHKKLAYDEQLRKRMGTALPDAPPLRPDEGVHPPVPTPPPAPRHIVSAERYVGPAPSGSLHEANSQEKSVLRQLAHIGVGLAAVLLVGSVAYLAGNFLSGRQQQEAEPTLPQIAGEANPTDAPKATRIVFDWPESERERAMLRIDGAMFGIPPSGVFQQKIQPGDHKFVLSRPRYLPIEVSLTFEPGEERHIKPEWRPLVPESELAGDSATTPSSGSTVNSKIPRNARKFGEHYYQFIFAVADWDADRRICERLGGHLVVIRNDAEQDFVNAIVSTANGYVFLGLTRGANQERWRWVDGSELAFAKWRAGEPTNASDIGTCACMNPRNGLWHAVAKTDPKVVGFVCEWDKNTDSAAKAAASDNSPPSKSAPPVDPKAVGEMQPAPVPRPNGEVPGANGAPPRQNSEGSWTITDDNQNLVAVFPEAPQYKYHISAEFGRVKEWSCDSKTGLRVSFQMLQKLGGDQTKTIAKFVDAQFRLNLDQNLSQELDAPTQATRITIPDAGILVLKFITKGRNLSLDEIAMFHEWSGDLRASAKWLEKRTNAELLHARLQPWVVLDDNASVLASFPAEPEYRYSVGNALPLDSRARNTPKTYARVRDWKCTKDGTLFWFRLYKARGSDEINAVRQAALYQARIPFDITRLNLPNGVGWETVTPTFVARVSNSGGDVGILTVKTNGRELSGEELDCYESWAEGLPLGDYYNRRRAPKIKLGDLETRLLSSSTRKTNAPRWPITIGGRDIAAFPSKPTHHTELTGNQGKVQEWTTIDGQTRVSFYTVTVSDARSIGSSGDLKKWLTAKFGIEDPRYIPPLWFLRPNLLVDLEWTREAGTSSSATVLAISTKATTLSQKELELYDEWDGDHRKEDFEAVADYLGENVK